MHGETIKNKENVVYVTIFKKRSL